MHGKAELLAAIAGKNRGVWASPTDRQAILALAAQLEDRNPTPQPLESADLAGDWQLLYTSSEELLGLDRWPVVKLGPIYQCIRPQTKSVLNIAELYGVPWCEGLVSVVASFQPVSRQRVEVQFERAIIGLQRMCGYQTPSQWCDQIAAGQKFWPLDFAISRRPTQAWLEVTYLDQDLRISRGNQGNIFILKK
jgi:PAP_fibrillin